MRLKNNRLHQLHNISVLFFLLVLNYLAGCTILSVATDTAGVAVGVAGVAVKATGAVVGAVIPDDDEDKEDDNQ